MEMTSRCHLLSIGHMNDDLSTFLQSPWCPIRESGSLRIRITKYASD